MNTWDDVQAKCDSDCELAQRMMAEEQKELTDVEKAKLFMEFLKNRRKFFASKSAEEKRSKLPTQAQQRSIMCHYLENMEGYKLNALKNKSFETIQEMFDRAFKRVNTFVGMETGTELEQESSKKQKVEEDKDTAELKQFMVVIQDD